MIFVATIALLGSVRVDGTPTSELSRYVQADRPDDLPSLVRNWCDKQGLPYGYISKQAPAMLQDLSKYQDPASMIGAAA